MGLSVPQRHDAVGLILVDAHLQLRRHGDEFTRDLHIHHFHLPQIVHVLVENEGDGNVVNTDLIPCDEGEQKVERPLKGL